MAKGMRSPQKIMEAADAQDRRRQNQIKQQMVRMDNMKLIINHLAEEIRSFEEAASEYEPREVRPVSTIINDAIIRANRD